MRLKIITALFLMSVIVPLSTAIARHDAETHAAATVSMQTGKPGAGKSVLTVSEIDAEGLKKVLQRGPQASHPLLVNFWATWCEPCREEFPDLVKIAEAYKARGLDFALVSLDDAEDINTKVPEFLREMRVELPSYLLNVNEPETAIQAVDPTWKGDLPATFLYDAQGQVVFRHMGRIKPDELRAAIEKTMNDER